MKEIMMWIMNNYMNILIGLVIAGGAILALVKFFKLTPAEQKKRILTILLDACIKAEQALGSKTGKAKRAQVYAALREAMPIISLFLSMEQFDELLDLALDEMKKWLAANAEAARKITEIVE